MKQRVLDVPGLPIKTIVDDTNRALFDKSRGINPPDERADAHVLPTSNRPGFMFCYAAVDSVAVPERTNYAQI
jgi:hypothetical protein